MQAQTSTTDLVLIGGGHSHLAVIKKLGMQPIPGLRITVISRDIHTPYSGMIPGLIAGHYQHDDAHIDLRPLCQFANARLFHSEVERIDLNQQLIYCNNRPAVRYDWLSVNTGSRPDLNSILGAKNTGTAIKPIDSFLTHWQEFVESLLTSPRPVNIAVVGGGAASVEVIMSVQHQLKQTLGHHAHPITFKLLCAGSTLLAQHNPSVQRFMFKTLNNKGINVRLNCSVVSAQDHPNRPGQKILQLSTEEQLVCDEVIWSVHAASPQWVKNTGIQCDDKGFIEVNPALQSTSHANVFAAGDIAHFKSQPLAKSGVYAVRAGKVLAENLRRAIQNKPLRHYRPQKRFLSLLMTGNQYAIASKGKFSVSGSWVWRLKNQIDKKFMHTYSQLPAMATDSQPALSKTIPTSAGSVTDQIRCGGCGAKINHRILSNVMAKLSPIKNDDVLVGLDSPDDAAIIIPPMNKQWLQTIDYFRAFIDDPYLLGKIATNHCLSDIYAMGATPHSALALATIPYGSDNIVEDTLFQLMHGCVESLNEQSTALIGGHTNEGAEMGFGLSVNGILADRHATTKSDLAEEQQLILTKPLGTGTILAANMLGKAQGRWVDRALIQMLINNHKAAQIIHQYQATACTDITGFGLMGHLLEMLKVNGFSATLFLQEIPLLDGAIECANNGWLSSLHQQNSHVQEFINNYSSYSDDNAYPLLFDPQTSGGLLAAVPKCHVSACLSALKQADCTHATIIGEIGKASQHTEVVLKNTV